MLTRTKRYETIRQLTYKQIMKFRKQSIEERTARELSRIANLVAERLHKYMSGGYYSDIYYARDVSVSADRLREYLNNRFATKFTVECFGEHPDTVLLYSIGFAEEKTL